MHAEKPQRPLRREGVIERSAALRPRSGADTKARFHFEAGFCFGSLRRRYESPVATVFFVLNVAYEVSEMFNSSTEFSHPRAFDQLSAQIRV